MNNFRQFIVRVLQVLWVLSFALLVFALFSDLSDIYGIIGLTMVWASILVIIQYLIFASFNPLDLFNGYLGSGLRSEGLNGIILKIGLIILISSAATGFIYDYFTKHNSKNNTLTPEVEIQDNAVELPLSVVFAYNNGELNEIQEQELEYDVKNGLVYPPEGFVLKKNN